MPNIRAVVLDVGGTLIYPAEPIGETYARVARSHGMGLDAAEATVAFRAAFKSASPRRAGSIPRDGNDRAWWKLVVKGSLPKPVLAESANFEKFFEEVYLYYAKPEAWNLFPEVIEVLETLRERAMQLVALSNWDARLHAVLEGHGLGQFFSRCFISAELGWEKPDPAIYHHVAKALDLPPTALLSVGDDPINDGEGARQAGWDAVLIDRPKTDLWAAVRALDGAEKVRAPVEADSDGSIS